MTDKNYVIIAYILVDANEFRKICVQNEWKVT